MGIEVSINIGIKIVKLVKKHIGHAKPIIVGPNMYNFKDSFALLSKVGACKQIEDAGQLTDVLLEVFKDDDLRARMGKASLQVIHVIGLLHMTDLVHQGVI